MCLLSGSSVTEALDRTISIVDLFVSSLAHAEGLDEKERGPADELIALAVACLVGVSCLPASGARAPVD